MASVIDRNRISWCSSAEDCSGASRFICLQPGAHRTEGASRSLIFCLFVFVVVVCLFSKPSRVQTALPHALSG